MAQIKIWQNIQCRMDSNVLPILTPDTISTVVEDVVGTSSTKRTVYIDDTTLPTKISFKKCNEFINVRLFTFY